MTNQEVLEKAIQKVIDGGWEEILSNEQWRVVTDRGLELDIEMTSPTGNLFGERKYYMEIIFNQDFAKALWGEHTTRKSVYHKMPKGVKHGDTADGSTHTSKQLEELFNKRYRCEECNKLTRTYDQLNSVCYTAGVDNPGWQYHLANMVIADDPIEYLGDNI